MIDLYYWPTPNGHKISIMLEECALDWTLKPVNIGQGEQFDPGFLKISPNNRMPAIVDHAPADGGASITLFESGAILEYLADKAGRFLPRDARARFAVLQWLYWQMSGVGPMFGQASHFANYAPERIDYAVERYTREGRRLLGVLDDELAQAEYVAGEYSIADMAIYPWVLAAPRVGIVLDDVPHVTRWLEAIKARPAVVSAYAKGKEISAPKPDSEEARKILFGQDRIRKS